MTTPMRVLRSLLFLPGDPDQQEREVQAIETELRIGKAQVRAVRNEIEKAHSLRGLLNDVIGRLK